MDSEVLIAEHAAVEAAYIVSGIIVGEKMTAAEERLFEAAHLAAKSNLPCGQVRWTEEGRLTNGAKHCLEQTLRAVQHLMLNN